MAQGFCMICGQNIDSGEGEHSEEKYSYLAHAECYRRELEGQERKNDEEFGLAEYDARLSPWE